SSQRWHNLALQGPASRELLRSLSELDSHWSLSDLNQLNYFHFVTGSVSGIPVLISRTGYTGELGYELFVDPERGRDLWDSLMQAGSTYDLLPL
ncbi:aminomethyl transferase family protein, partial [Haemophilus parainfluenzae]